MARSKYKTRADGRKTTTRTYKDFGQAHFSGKKTFYGKTDADVDKNIAEWEKSLLEKKSAGFSVVADKYWNEKQKDLSINTLKGYKVAVVRAKRYFGDTPVADITPHDIYDYLLSFKAQCFSQKVINNTKCVVKQIFDYAFIIGEVDVNPCSVPQVKGKARVPREAASENDIRKLEEVKTESMIGRFMYFLLYTGARRGEAQALQWKDIDLDRKIARVTKTLAYGSGNDPIIKCSPKTEAGCRDLQLLDNVIEILPPRGKPNDYVFFPNGLPKRKKNDTEIDDFKEKHKIKCTPHQLRHSYASMLHAADVNVKDAQTLLGHASITMTQDIYTHLDRQRKEAVRDNLNAYVQRKVVAEVVTPAENG